MTTNKNISDKVKALFELKISNIAAELEAPGQKFFCGDNRLMDREEVADFSHEIESLVASLLGSEDPRNLKSPEFHAMQVFFGNLSHRVLMRGGHVEDMVRYTKALQNTLIEVLEKTSGIPFGKSQAVWLYLDDVFNELVMAVFGAYLKEREQTLQAQQAEIRETATPITEIWDGVLTLPIIGTLDSNRTMLVMEALLNRIAKDHAKAVVMDLTGVKNIDSQVSHHLIQMVRAVQLMGSHAIVTGIHPEIARALVSLDIDFNNITTRASMADGLKEAFSRMGITVSH
ncbi:MAG: STAS domain-containing protein [Gallionella sp.]|nr:STAS domain-containing protein [Gallionella sp.]